MCRAERLFLPPTESRLLLRLTIPAERVGLTFARRFAGVVLIEAEKQIYVGTAVPAHATAQPRRYVPILDGLAAARTSQAGIDAGEKLSSRTGRHCLGARRRAFAAHATEDAYAAMQQESRRVISISYCLSRCWHVACCVLRLQHDGGCHFGIGAPSHGASDVPLHADIRGLLGAARATAAQTVELPWDGSLMQCMLFGQQVAAQWTNEHPGWALLRGWRCESGRSA